LLAGCGSSASTGVSNVPTTIVAQPNPATSQPRVQGEWSGTLPTGDRVGFTVEPRPGGLVEGDGALFHEGDPRILKVEGRLEDSSRAVLQLVSLDEGTAGQTTDLVLEVQPNGSAQGQLLDQQSFPLTRRADDPGTSQKLWNADRTHGGPETYRIDAKDEFGHEFHLRATVDIRNRSGTNDANVVNGDWRQIDGGKALYVFLEGKAYGTSVADINWITLYFRDETGTGTYGQVMFERSGEGRPGSTKPLSRSDSILSTRDSFGYVTGTATLEVP